MVFEGETGDRDHLLDTGKNSAHLASLIDRIKRLIDIIKQHPAIELSTRAAWVFLGYSAYASARAIQGAFIGRHGPKDAEAMAYITAIVNALEVALVKAVGFSEANEIANDIFNKHISPGLTYQASMGGTITVGLPLSIILTVGLQNYILKWIGVDKEVINIIKNYFYIFGPAFIPIALTYAVKQPSWVIKMPEGCAIDATYAVLDTLLAVGFNELIGVPGIALGAAISSLLTTTGVLGLYNLPKSRYRTQAKYPLFDRHTFREIFKKFIQMIPSQASFFFPSLLGYASNLTALSLLGIPGIGTPTEIAAFGVANNVVTLADGIGHAMEYAIGSVFPKALGEKKYKLAAEYFLYGNALSLIVPTGILAVTQFFPGFLTNLFVKSDDPLMVPTVQFACLLGCITQLFDNMGYVSGNVGREVGHKAFVTWANIIPMLLNVGLLFAFFFTEKSDPKNIFFKIILWLQLAEAVLATGLIFSVEAGNIGYRAIKSAKEKTELSPAPAPVDNAKDETEPLLATVSVDHEKAKPKAEKSLLSILCCCCCFWSHQAPPDGADGRPDSVSMVQAAGGSLV